MRMKPTLCFDDAETLVATCLEAANTHEASVCIAVVDEATTGHETLQRLSDSACDLVLLDLSLPDIDGLDLLKQLKREHPQRPVLILTMHSEDQFALRALKAGASGYLTKESAPAELVGAVRKVVAGGRYTRVSTRFTGHAERDPTITAAERTTDAAALTLGLRYTR